MSVPVAPPPKTKSQALRSYDVADFPALTGREEEWRFTPLRRLRDLVAGDGAGAGVLSHEYDPLPGGLSVSTVDKRDPRMGSLLVPFDRISALAWGRVEKATLVSVAPGQALAEPARIQVTGDGLTFGHTFVEIGELAEATLVIEHTGSATLADNVEVSVGNGARLTLVTVGDWSRDAVQAQ